MREFTYGKYSYAYDWVRQDRKTLSLTVYPDKRIVVKAPSFVSENRIHEFLKRKYAWLNKQLRFFDKAKRPQAKKEYVSGESFFYLGRQYKLVVKEGKESGVKLAKGTLRVTVGDHRHNGRTGQKLLEEWFKHRTEAVLTRRFDEIFETFSYPKKPKLSLRAMKTRWGSCSKKGTVTLNTNLIQAPTYCIDYVIMHELCHLIEHNHSARYYQLLDRKIPDWRKRKKRLEEEAK